MQLKRWHIRKNATRREWQQFFAANKDQPIANSLGNGPGTNFAPVILRKSTASKKRASRWVPGSIVAPKPVPAPHVVLAPQVSDSTSLGNEEHPNRALSLNEPIVAPKNTQPGSQHASQNTVNSFHATESFPLMTGLYSINNFTTHSVVESRSQAPGVFAEALNTPLHSLEVSLTYSVAPGLQSLVHGQGAFDLAEFSVMELPAGNKLGTLMLQDIRQILPFAQLEQSILSRDIMLARSSGHTVFGGFASKVVAGILSSKDQSTARQTPNFQRFLRKLGYQIPGESSALITDDQAFESKFARLLLFSMINGFAGLDDVPIDNLLKSLNRFVVDKLLLDILEQCPRHVSRTLADNIFRAAIEAADAKVVNLLLSRKLVDVNNTVCFHDGKKYTPIQRAAARRSLKLMQSLINAGADVNKSHASFQLETVRDALGALSNGIKACLWINDPQCSEATARHESLQAFNLLVAAGARPHPEMMILDESCRTVEFDFLVCQGVPPESHQKIFMTGPHMKPENCPLTKLTEKLDDCRATILVRKVISLCDQADCNQCLVDFRDLLINGVMRSILAGQAEVVQLLFSELDLHHELQWIFITAIRSQNLAMIDLILSFGPELDPPAIVVEDRHRRILRTPLSEAVRHGNQDLIRKLEVGGSLDHLNEGDRFEAVVAGAAEAGNTAYMRKLLARSVTSKQAYRETGQALDIAICCGHFDIVQMLLETGAAPGRKSSLRMHKWNRDSFHETLSLKDIQMVHDLIASADHPIIIRETLNALVNQSLIADVVPEYTDLIFNSDNLSAIAENYIETDTVDSLKELLKTLECIDGNVSLDGCLRTAVELGHGDLVEFLLDTGADPFSHEVLQAVIPDRPEMLQLLFQKERRLQTKPRCIGARILEPVMGNGAGNSEALDELIKTEAINLARRESLYDSRETPGLRREYYDSIRFTPLGMAIHGVPGRFDSNMVAMKKLLEAGADPNEISKSNKEWTKGSPLMTALMVAVETGLEDAVNMLLDYGADVNARPRIRTTRTALQFAAELGNMEIVRLLLDRGADANSLASSRGGATALQFAAMTGNCNMMAYLLDHGAQLDALPSRIDGMWPLEGAAANGRLDMVRFLWELNVRLVAGGTFPDGFSERHCLRAMNFARENGHIGCRDLISELSGISVDRLETDEYGAPWIAYCD